MAAIAFRTGLDRTTFRPLVGWAHVQQSLGVIWTTRIGSRVMRLLFGSDLRSWLSEDVTVATALGIYDELITAAHRWEPEYRVTDMQLVRLGREGVLGLRHSGLYYPEGRLGNYAIAIPEGGSLPLAAQAILTRGRAR
ncbi:GPW/gp25 family protein [Prosthecomicrobium hirschii]|uniref:GPW/gp25 family protein n=1 Tax=Prosthecodimorpha hirschii TaxID=665126 RepID=UPI00112AEC1C|nr:GPW/gp25 family protein [Prosthecomicrobium hirschii]MCW1842301.1 GPW/gp25 family protein [Prosthecomicrobium hirschii]TPQ52397.1 integrase [Prosthecomicrobium hirschii]